MKWPDTSKLKKGVWVKVAKVVAALGAAPIATPMTETYDAVNKGVADGYVAPIEALKGFKLAEVVRFTTQDYGAAYSVLFRYHGRRWYGHLASAFSLSPHYQTVFG
ncbi:MAG: hypothetical protein ACLQPD_35975 [Desulfomonilaceae bacterium]